MLISAYFVQSTVFVYLHCQCDNIIFRAKNEINQFYFVSFLWKKEYGSSNKAIQNLFEQQPRDYRL